MTDWFFGKILAIMMGLTDECCVGFAFFFGVPLLYRNDSLRFRVEEILQIVSLAFKNHDFKDMQL